MTKRKKLVLEGSCLDKSYEGTSVLSNQSSHQVTNISKNTYVVPSSNDFAGEDDPCYLDKCYLDFFSFGRGGLGDGRKFPILNQALLYIL